MRAYEVQIKNSAEWMATGAISETFLVLAEDFISAMMYATNHMEEITVQLMKSGCHKVGALRIISIGERFGVVAGNVVQGHEDMDWIEKLAERVREKNKD